MKIPFTASVLNGSCPWWLVTECSPPTVVLVWSGLVWSGDLLLAFANTIILGFAPSQDPWPYFSVSWLWPWSGNLLLAFTGTDIPGLRSFGTHDHISLPHNSGWVMWVTVQSWLSCGLVICCWSLPAVILDFGPWGTHDIILSHDRLVISVVLLVVWVNCCWLFQHSHSCFRPYRTHDCIFLPYGSDRILWSCQSG
jgi:hypothetical protein